MLFPSHALFVRVNPSAAIDTSPSSPSLFLGGASDLDADASLAPMSPLRIVSAHTLVLVAFLQTLRITAHICPQSIFCVVVPDRVARPQPNPLWDGSVLLLRFRELLLRSEGLVGLPGYHQHRVSRCLYYLRLTGILTAVVNVF